MLWCMTGTVLLQESNSTTLGEPLYIPTVDDPYYCAYCRCQSHNSIAVIDCANAGLKDVPKNIDNNTGELYLQRNEIRRITSEDFAGLTQLRILDISRNNVEQIDNDAFVDLHALEILILHSQRLKSLQTFVPTDIFYAGVFHGLVLLKRLEIHGNIDKDSETSVELPVDAFLGLVALEELYIDVVGDLHFDDRFSVLENLTTIYVSGITGTCRTNNLTSRSFEGIQNIRNLTLQHCSIQTINTNTFSFIPQIEYLDISDNPDIGFEQFATISYPLQYSTIKILKIDSICDPHGAGTELYRHHMDTIQRMKLTELSMNDNAIEYVAYGVLGKLPHTLKRFYLRRNKLLFRILIAEAVFNNPNLELIDAGDQRIIKRTPAVQLKDNAEVDRERRSTGENYSAGRLNRNYVNVKAHNNGDKFRPPSRQTRQAMPIVNITLKRLVCSGSYSNFPVKIVLNFSDTINVIEYIDWSRNFMPHLDNNSFDGLSHVKVLNLSKNNIEQIKGDTRDMFSGLDSIEVLDLSNNLLGDILRYDEQGEAFSSIRTLHDLNLSNNRIYYLGFLTFAGLHNLKTLDLSRNYMETLDCTFTHFGELQMLNLANNRLATLSPSIRNYLSDSATYHHVQVDLSNNNLDCNCDNIPFLEWLQTSSVKFKNKQSYYCTMRNHSIRVFGETAGELLEWIREDCKFYQTEIIAASSTVAFILVIIFIVAIYLNRWKLRYLYYMARLPNGNKAAENDNGFVYDVFVSYADGDRDFVALEMIETLEGKMNVQINIRDRDFEIGESIAVNISKAIKESRRTFLLVSRHFLTNKWCTFELNMARMEELYRKRDVIVVVFLEQLPEKDLPVELVDLLREKPTLHLPDDDERHVFWERCRELIN